MMITKKIYCCLLILFFFWISSGYAQSPSATAEASPYVEVEGKRLTIGDVEREMSKEYVELVQETNDKLFRLLLNLGIQKMMQLEARELKTTLREYADRIRKRAKPPGETELKKIYNALKESGQITESYSDARSQLIDLILSENQQSEMENEIERLKKKYKFIAWTPSAAPKEANIENEPFRGNAEAKILVVEFSDFECPFCLKSQVVSRQIREKYKDKIKWVFKDFPLSFHKKAMGAHIAANCVNLQSKEKYWKYFDSIFDENRTEDFLTAEWLERKAKSLDLDMGKYKTCLADENVKKEIEADIAEAAVLGIKGTPTFIINGKAVEGAQPMEVFESILGPLK